MKAALALTLAATLSCSLMPAAHADSDSSTAASPLAHQVPVQAARDGVSMSHVSVLTQGGAVTLVGWLPESGQVALAERSAYGVDGVTSVNNLLSRGH
jgi:hypothetical protein